MTRLAPEVGPTDEERRMLRQAIGDPGSFTRRADDYTEQVTTWSARAVMLSGWLSPSQVEAEVQAVREIGDTPTEGVAHAIRFAQGKAVTRHAMGHTDAERDWLDIIHLLERATNQTTTRTRLPVDTGRGTRGHDPVEPR